ncbi:hypothetical protein BpHYR1_039824 [Brachionus plicatilis]|uniref:Uncharacterized protein n=1 Tax=Brachionus plicatilis TaxID=10195 RepID=A0A3M7T419_BRAPC|nr:hypothetical protein BpHYR1_039824 [Brachionus plicatilis]
MSCRIKLERLLGPDGAGRGRVVSNASKKLSVVNRSLVAPPASMCADGAAAVSDLNMYLEANTMPKTVHCMATAQKSITNMTSLRAAFTWFLLSRNLRSPGMVQTAFMMRMARDTSSLGSTRNTNMDIPKLCAVSITRTKSIILSVGHGLLPNNDLNMLSQNKI